MKRLAIAAVIVALSLPSCGDPSMSRATARGLRDDVALIRAAVEDGRAFLARQRLTALGAEVADLLDRGDLDAAKAAEILDAIDVVRAALGSMPAASPTVTETSPPPAEEEEDEGGGNAYGHDKDKGGGHGNGGEGNGED